VARVPLLQVIIIITIIITIINTQAFSSLLQVALGILHGSMCTEALVYNNGVAP
jgi:hypothetical protein